MLCNLCNDSKIPSNIPINAVKNNHLECLSESIALWSENVCHNAALYGYLNLLEYAHQHGCLINEWTAHYAASSQHLDCLEYLLSQNCPIFKSITGFLTLEQCKKYKIFDRIYDFTNLVL